MRGLFILLVIVGSLPLAAQPVIDYPGAVNAASYSPAGLPNSAIAQGSIFLVFGRNLGPASIVSASSPLTTTLAGTSAQITVNGTAVSPWIVYTSASQVAMVMPSSTPVGSGTITVTYNGQTSTPAALQVSAGNFGIFTMNQAGSGPAVVTDADYVNITLTHAASPGQTLVLWGTGLGKISADETQAPPAGNVGVKPTVWVGLRQAPVLYWGRSPCCAGLDQINFQVPSGVAGCHVPIAVQIGTAVSNFGSISVADRGSSCSDPNGLGAAQLTSVQNGQNLNVATVSLARSIVTTRLPAASSTTTTDSGSATFLRYTPAQLLASNFGQAVSPGGCMVFPISGRAAVTDPVHPLGLDAGAITIGGTNGTVELRVSSAQGYYSNTFGSGASGPFYLDIPMHTVNVFGGADVGSFAQELQMPPSLIWTNAGNISTVSESQGVTLVWSNAVPNGYVTINGYSLTQDQSGKFGAGAAFYCSAEAGPNGAGQFVVPPAVLLSLPLSATSSSTIPGGFLGISSSRVPSDAFPATRGIDAAFTSTSLQMLQNVVYAQ